MLFWTRAPTRLLYRTNVSIATLAAVDGAKIFPSPLVDTLTSTAGIIGARNFPHPPTRPRRRHDALRAIRGKSPRRRAISVPEAYVASGLRAVGDVRETPAADAWVLSAEPRRVRPAVEHSFRVRRRYGRRPPSAALLVSTPRPVTWVQSMDSAAVDDSDASPFVDASTMVSEADSTSVEAAPPLPRSSLESKSTATATATTTTTVDSGSSASSSSSSSSSSTHTATVPALSAVQSFGFAEDANLRFRQSNEDGHAFIDRFCGKRDDAFFAIYDGHGGREAVEIIEQRLHQLFAEEWLRATAVAERADDIRPAADAEDRSSKAGFSTADHHHVAPVTPGDGNVHHAQRAFQRAYARMDRELESHHCAYVGSTSITCLLSRDATSGRRYLYTANAGDSRAILRRARGATHPRAGRFRGLPPRAGRALGDALVWRFRPETLRGVRAAFQRARHRRAHGHARGVGVRRAVRCDERRGGGRVYSSVGGGAGGRAAGCRTVGGQGIASR
eukprot:ctg_714.g297